MEFYYIKGCKSDVKARAVAYIRDRLPIRPVKQNLYEWGDDGRPVKPAAMCLTYEHHLITNGPLSAFHDNDPVVVERVVDATGIKLLGYDDRAVRVEPIDLTVDENKRGFRSKRSAAYCGMHAAVAIYKDPALWDVKTQHGLTDDPDAVSLCFNVGLSKVDVGRILSNIVATATRVIEGDAR